ncbi:MAG: SRPBCC family protein [Rhodospirillales bacterium]|nr:SRPBCC family protein [Rhodospirillales bacterium]
MACRPGIRRWKEAPSKRAVTTAAKTGGWTTEQLEEFHGEAKTYTYSIVTSPLSLADCHSTITAKREGERSTIEWSTAFTPLGVAETELARSLEKLYESGLDNLRKLLGTNT